MCRIFFSNNLGGGNSTTHFQENTICITHPYFHSLIFLVPPELQQLLSYVESTSQSYSEIMNSLSTSPSVADSIWGVICKKVHGRNNQASNDMITDISATQEYYRNLLKEKPIPGYVQYFC